MEAMNFMFREGLVVPGTMVGYDDWWSTPCALGPPTTDTGLNSGKRVRAEDYADHGEMKAHYELTSKYHIEWEW